MGQSLIINPSSLQSTFFARGVLMPNAAEILVDTPIDWHVEVVFGLPGDV
jgi:hypothetical protein